MTERAWRRVGDGERTGVVLAVDFDSTMRAEAGFGTFSRLLRPGHPMWLSCQPDAAEHELLDAEAYLRWWRDRPPMASDGVHTVIGYCVGGVFAAAVADEIARAGTRPRLLLIDPEPVDLLSPYRDFTKAVDAMPVLTAEERAAWSADARAACEDSGDRFDAAVTTVVKLYQEASELAFERLGLDEETGEELRGLFHSYMSYLHAARQLTPEESWATAVALTSAQSSPGAVYAREERRFPVGTAEMLQDRRVATATQTLLEESAT